MTTLTFRAAVAADVPALVAFVNAAYRGDSSKAGWTTEADILGGQRTDAGKLTEMIRDGRVELACDDDGALAACVYLRKEAGGACYLGMLTVDPRRQAGGLGRRLLERSEEVAREWRCPRVRMTVIDVRAELIAWYERRGYARTGKTEPFPAGDPRFGLPKVADLRFCELVKELK
jgi:GNAT superfamily N-acetyltransferase